MMKKLLVILLLFKLSIIAANADPGKTTINCTVHGYKKPANPNWLPAGLILYQVKNGSVEKVEVKRPDAEGKFSYTVDVKEGIYFLSTPSKGGSFKHVLYLKAGELKNVGFYNGYDSSVVDKPNAETNALQAWINAFNMYVNAAKKKPAESYRQYDEFVQFASSFLKSNKTSNTYFNNWLGDKIDTDVKYFRAANFFRFGRLNGTPDSGAAVQSFYKPLYDKKTINDARLLRSEHGMELLNYTFGYWKIKEGEYQRPGS
jgi:hypothetical protein